MAQRIEWRLLIVLEGDNSFGSQRRFMDLFGKLTGNVGQACIVGELGVGCVPAEDNLFHPEPFTGTENSPHVMG